MLVFCGTHFSFSTKLFFYRRNFAVLLYGQIKIPSNSGLLIVCQSRNILETKYCPKSMATEVATGHTSNRHCCSEHHSQILTKVLQYHDHLSKRVIRQRNFLPFIATQRNIMKHFYKLKHIDLSAPQLHRTCE